ncbi:ABC multidrug efflux transporter [Synechococcus sp. PROS-7-1]|uniref:peptidase domain-containing ABC transporter n=1 Tax=Synechococcus sp. PROS-7-1 TaxID=1442556 RepID=UPI001645D34F|nr:peptidase domain-containing ABC transporter [Synechococcus sp. PROS-7-1]QNI83970.1 ABC multidrug efflux transporter [Synechococcus sp. PROS-7-1]
MSTVETLQGLLRRFEAFAHLSEGDLKLLSEQAQPFSCSTGQELLKADRMPEQVYAIVEGRGRLLHNDPGVRRPLTLALCHPGDLVGWAGLACNHPCEWLTASTPLKLIGIPADTFLALAESSDSLRAWVDRNNSPAEIITALEPSLRKRPHADPDEREVLRRLLPHMQVIQARGLRRLPAETPEAIWLWDSLPCADQAADIRIGEPVDPKQLAALAENQSLRLLRIDAEAWERELSPPLESPDVVNQISSTNLWQGDRYADMAAPEPTGAITTSTPSAADGSGLGPKLDRLPVRTGIGPVAQALACIDMLCAFHGMPFRRDVLERITKEKLRDRPASLQSMGELLSFASFRVNQVDIAVHQIHRASTPCVALVQNQPTVLYKVVAGEVLGVIPEFGRVRFPVSELGAPNEGLRMLVVTPGADSQRRKLGFGWFLPQLRKYRRSLIEVLVASLILQLLTLANPLIIQQIIDKVIAQQNLDTLYVLGMLLLIVSVFQGLLGALRTYLFADTTNRIDIALGGEVIQHLLRLPLRYFDKRPVGELQTRLGELANIRGFLTGTAITLLLDSVFSVIYIGVMVAYSGVLTVVSLGVVPLFLGLTLLASPIIRSQLRKAAEKNAVTQSQLVEALNGVQTIKAQNAEMNMRWRWQRNYSAFMSESFRTLLIGVSTGTAGSFLNELTGLLTLWVGAFLVIKGELTIGQLIAFRIISGYVVGPLLRLATSWQSFQGVALSIERLSDVVDAKAEGETESGDQLPLPPVAGEVSFQGVDFRFNEGAPYVVKNVSFSVPAGSFAGIVGRSGSGKSTIMKLLPRLYEPEAGRILIDGYDINKLELSSIRRQIGIVPQDSLLFDGTVRENITLTAPEATSEEITYAAKVACAHDFIMELPQGYGSRVGERGSALSGGQRQRIAIARAVLQRPRLLILDEATSALDYITERQVCLNLKKAFEGSTVFFITHRLSTIRAADVILMMDQGSLVEQGSHAELLEQEGRYFALYTQQDTGLD